MYPPVGSGTSSTVSFVVLFLASMGVLGTVMLYRRNSIIT